MKVALALRGHIRDGLVDSRLREYVSKLLNFRYVSSLDIYCHTWKEHEAKSSYRALDRDCILKVTPDLVKHYFGKELRGNIKNIQVQDDSKISLIGSTEGNVCKSKIPVISWKRMWAGKKQVIDSIIQSGVEYDSIINTRYDLFTMNACKMDESVLTRLVRMKGSLNFRYPIFTRGPIGVDNFYTGKPEVMKKLIYAFHDNLDDIMTRYPTCEIQEKIVYDYARENGLIYR